MLRFSFYIAVNKVMAKQWRYRFIFFFFLFSLFINATAQSRFDYKVPEDILVQQKLKEWGDMKFGLMITWGPDGVWMISAPGGG